MTMQASKRKGEITYFDINTMQLKSAVKPFEIYHRKKKFPWVGVLMFLGSVVGLIWLFISIY